MATKKAILEAYTLLAINAKLIDQGTDHKQLNILLKSWEFAFNEIDDRTLGYAVERFLKEVKEVNRSMVISAKILELCSPLEKPFNEFIVPQTINKMIEASRSLETWKKLKAETDPLLWEIIEDYPFSAIQEGTTEQLPTIYSQIRNDYRLRYQAEQVEIHNQRLKTLQLKGNNILALEAK